MEAQFFLIKVLVAVLVSSLRIGDCLPQEGGYSFHKFSGPLSGNIQRVDVHGLNPHGNFQAVDFIAKPDYTYSYGIEDPETGNKQERHESRDGDAVKGEYSLVEPDGTVRVVRYTADATNGFQVNVEYIKPGEQRRET